MSAVPDPRQELERALAVLASDAPPPEEPNVRQFVARPDGAVRNQITQTVDHEAWHRWERQRRRNERRVARWWRENVPVPCGACGVEFYRDRIVQKRCRPCIAKAKEYEA